MPASMTLPQYNNPSSPGNFSVTGVNYRKSDATARGLFSLSDEAATHLVQAALSRGITSCFVLSTCNRTEVYGIGADANILTNLLCESTSGDRSTLLNHVYCLRGQEAILHLFRVAAGLDSQIIGDYEILSQLKVAIQKARRQAGIRGPMERIINFALQASKEVKTKTKLSTGTVSVSYAAIEIIRRHLGDAAGARILLVGTGKFGNQIAGNLGEYFPRARVHLMNRTNEKAFHLAQKHQFQYIPYEKLSTSCDKADVIVVNSAAPQPVLFPHFFCTQKPRLILDLSMPANVDQRVASLPDILLQNVDEVSQILQTTRGQREREIPAAEGIIAQTYQELVNWYSHQANYGYIHNVKNHLIRLNRVHFENVENAVLMKKTISSLAIQLKKNPNKGCQCIAALNKYLHSCEEPATWREPSAQSTQNYFAE